jgi:hypothetical protein
MGGVCGGLVRDVGSVAATPRRRTLRQRRDDRRDERRQRADQQRKRKKKKKSCAQAGQPLNKKHKQCCSGLMPDASGVCVAPSSPPQPSCVPGVCPTGACGSVPDGCGGTLTCACAGNSVCQAGVCHACTVICLSGIPATCGSDLRLALSDGGTVYVCPGRYQGPFTVPASGVTVIGAGQGAGVATNTILDANGAGRVLEIAAGRGPVALERLRLTGGNTAGNGAGILHEGSTLRVTECTINGNTCNEAFGCGLSVAGGRTADLTRCTLRDNHTSGFGGSGGGLSSAGTTSLTDCLVEANSVFDYGGGLYLSGGVTTLAGATQVRGNQAFRGGGIFVSSGTLAIADTCRVTQNTAPLGKGGGIENVGGTVTLQSVANPSPIVVDNCHENCVGTVPRCAPPPVSC